MKIAIFHDYIGAIGGGEKLVLTLARGLGADVITTDVDEESIKKMGFTDVNIISLGGTIKMAPFKQISASLRFALCDFLRDYDFFVFSGNWAHFAAKKHKPNLLYCHTPARVFYDLYDTFLNRQPVLLRPLFMLWVALHRPFYEYYMRHVEKIVVNSKNTKSRIEKYLHRDAEVVYPPIDISRYRFKEYGDFWLSVNRLYPEKRIELQLDAFRQMPEEGLLIAGGFAAGDHASKYPDKIIKNLPDNVKLIGSVSEDALIELYATCRGLVTTAIDEDFGMTPVEAMASGKPVVAVREGGYLETVVDGRTGLLVEANAEAVISAVRSISMEPQKFRDECEKRAKLFDASGFIKSMTSVIQSIHSRQQDRT